MVDLRYHLASSGQPFYTAAGLTLSAIYVAVAGICPLDDNSVAVQNVQYQARTDATAYARIGTSLACV
jgi:hypothetical protein